MKPAIRTKRDMYALLSAGRLGNCLPQYFTLADWVNRDSDAPLWGVRVLKPGNDPRSMLNVPTTHVIPYVEKLFQEGEYNISAMVDHMVYFRAEVVELVGGMSMSYVLGFPYELGIPPSAHPWRYAFRYLAKHVDGVRAVTLLQDMLRPNDYEDVRMLLAEYPEHVVELSACSRDIGMYPNRSAVIWEVRQY